MEVEKLHFDEDYESSLSSSSSSYESLLPTSQCTKPINSDIPSNQLTYETSASPYEYFVNVLRIETPKSNEKLNSGLKNDLNEHTDKFYSKNKSKFMKVVTFDTYDEPEHYTTHEQFEQENEQSFKAIFKFSRQQARRLETKSITPEPPKMNKERFNVNKENHRLDTILHRHHLSSESKHEQQLNDDNTFSDSPGETAGEQFHQQHLNDHYSRSSSIQNTFLKANTIKSMYNRALLNEERAMHVYPIGGKHVRMNKSLSVQIERSRIDALNYSSSLVLSQRDERPMEASGSEKNFSFRVSVNKLNSNFEVFKP